MARNRYGWQKRAKEMARKEKNDEKMKRRQGKVAALGNEADPTQTMEEVLPNSGEDRVESEDMVQPD